MNLSVNNSVTNFNNGVSTTIQPNGGIRIGLVTIAGPPGPSGANGGGLILTVTGSAAINPAAFSGLGGTQVIYQGGQILISGSQGGGGVSSLNSLLGAISIVGTGGVTVSVNGQNILVSGDSSISGALTQSGISLYNLLTGLSGQANLNYATMVNLASTGQQLYGLVVGGDTNLSGNLAQTGIALRALVLGGDTNLSGNLTATGQTLYQLASGTSGNLSQSGAAILSTIAATGQQAWTAANANALNLSGNLTTTGQSLYQLASGTSGNLSQTGTTLLGFVIGGDTNLSGNLTQTGATLRALTLGGDTNLSGNLTLTGQTLYQLASGTSGNLSQSGAALLSVIASTGQQAWTAAQNNAVNLSGNLTLTGQSLYQLASGTSGNLTATGSTLIGFILGGDTNLSGNLTQTGVTLRALTIGGDTNLSGALTLTGQSLYQLASGTSGNLSQTGVTLLGFIIGGDTNISGNLTQTGITLRALTLGGDTNLSGNLTTTGQTLYQLASGTSGNLSQTGASLLAVIALTGQQAWLAAQNNALNLSGALAQTGTKLSAVQVTGSSVINAVNLTGLGGTLVIQSGGFVFISGAAAVAAGVTSVDGLVGAVTITGSGTVSTLIINGQLVISGAAAGGAGVSSVNGLQNAVNIVATGLNSLTVNGQNIIISGDTTISGALTSTGSTLYNLIANASGTFAPALANYVYQSGVQSITGIKTFFSELRFNSGLKTPVRFFGPGNTTATSGDYLIIATGTTISTTGILPSATDYSGVPFDIINGGSVSLQISGVIGPDTNPVLAPWDALQVYATSGQWWYLRQTGSPLLGMVTSLSGFVVNVVSGGLETRIGQTGQAAWSAANNNGINLSGNLTITGQTLYQLTSGTSGNLSVSGATLLAFTLGGDTNLSGNLTQTGVTLRALTLGGDTNISGNMATTGTLLSAIKVTGSSIQNNLNLTGVGTTVVWVSGSLGYISGNNADTVNLSGSLASTGQQAWTAAQNNALNLSGNLTTTGQTLYQLASGTSGNLSISGATLMGFIIGGDTNLSGNLTQTGVTLRALTLGGDTNLSGNLTLTGQTLYNFITASSGQSNTNYAPALANYFYTTGVQTATDIKTFGSEIRINSGLKTPAVLFGPANYSIGSGNLVVIATGALTNTTGILPNPTTVSGNIFVLINGGTTSLQVSGVIGPDTNPILAPNDALQAYAISGLWYYVRQTGSPLTSLVIGISGNLSQTGATILGIVAQTGQAAWTAANANGINLSGNLTATGQSLYQLASGTSGNLSQTGATLLSVIASTGQQAWLAADNNSRNLSGNLTLTGQSLYQLASGTSGNLSASGATLLAFTLGGDTNLSGNLTLTGVTLRGLTLGGDTNLSGNLAQTGATLLSTIFGGDANLSGNLTTTGTLLSAVKMTGSSVQNVLNLTGVGTVITWISGTNGYISGSNVDAINLSGNLALTGQQAWTAANVNAVNLSGNLTITGTKLSAVQVTGSSIINAVNLTGLGGTLVIQSGGFVFISGAGGGAAGGVTSIDGLAGAVVITGSGTVSTYVINGQLIISGAAGGGAGVSAINGLQNSVSIVGTGGLTVSVNGQNILVSGDSSISGALTTTGATLYSLLNNASGTFAPALANYVYQTGVQSITGIKTFASQIVINSGVSTPVRFFGPSNTTLTSGDWTVIATGTTASTTGILPSPTAYSGTFFNIINGGTVSLQLSGVIGALTNPLLAPFDGMELYATSGQWWSLASTGSPLTSLVIGISGNLTTTGQTLLSAIASTGQQAWTAADANARNISGNLTITGQTLFQLASGISGNLTTTGTLLSAFKVTGSTVINVANLTGIYGSVVTNSGTQVYVYDTKPVMVVPFIAGTLTWTNQPAALNFFNAISYYRSYVDLTNYTGVNLSVAMTTAGATSGALFLRYTDNPANVTVASYWPLTASGAETYTRLETANTVKQSGFQPIVPGARSGVYIALLGQSGSAAASPIFGLINAQFK